LAAGLLALESKAESLERDLAKQQEQLRDLDRSLAAGLSEAERDQHAAASELLTLELKVNSLARHLAKQRQLVQDLDKSLGVGLAEADRDRYSIASKLIELEGKIQSLGRHVAEQQDLLQDHDKTLVRRISQTEREREATEATATKLLEVAQIQRQEVKTGLGRLATTTGAALVLLAVLAGVLAFLAYTDLKEAQKPLREEIAAIKIELDRRADAQPADDAITKGFERLNERVNEMSSSLKSMGAALANNRERAYNTEDPVADVSAPSGITEAVHDGTDEQQHLLEELEATQTRESAALLEEVAQTTDAKPLTAILPVTDAPPEVVDIDAGAAPEKSSAKPRTVEAEAVRGEGDAADRVAQTDAPSGFLEAAASKEDRPQTSNATTVTEILPVTDVPLEVGDIDAPPGEAKDDAAETLLSEREASPVESDDAMPINVPAAGDHAYALQLIGFFTRDALQAFVSRENLPKRMYYIEERYRRRPWFALIHSLHADYASAQETRSRLAPDLVAMEPWIRPLRGSEALLMLEPGKERLTDR
jgi:septal ring-binding cell division protein DamX